jgi:hypothetical protein
MKRTAIAALFLALAGEARAEPIADVGQARPPELRSFHAPDHLKLQTGGFLGLATVGLGLSAFEDHLNVTGYYGWVPQSVGGIEIHSFAMVLVGRAARSRFGDWRWIPVYAGAGALYVRGEGFFVVLPDRYPDGYYLPTGIRALGVLGTELELRASSGTDVASHGAFLEVVALDVLVHHWAANRDSVSLLEVFSTGLGYKLRWP